jgi:hypothetical protein
MYEVLLEWNLRFILIWLMLKSGFIPNSLWMKALWSSNQSLCIYKFVLSKQSIQILTLWQKKENKLPSECALVEDTFAIQGSGCSIVVEASWERIGWRWRGSLLLELPRIRHSWWSSNHIVKILPKRSGLEEDDPIPRRAEISSAMLIDN